MQVRRPHLTLAVAAIAAVLVLAATLLVSGRVVEALSMIAVVAGLAGMYRLRRYARAELLYRRRPEPLRRHAEGAPGNSARAARGAVTNGSGARSANLADARERRVSGRM
jgi:hypothetical protein